MPAEVDVELLTDPDPLAVDPDEIVPPLDAPEGGVVVTLPEAAGELAPPEPGELTVLPDGELVLMPVPLELVAPLPAAPETPAPDVVGEAAGA